MTFQNPFPQCIMRGVIQQQHRAVRRHRITQHMVGRWVGSTVFTVQVYILKQDDIFEIYALFY